MDEMRNIEGRCHCDNIAYRVGWPGDGRDIPVRACGCTFCTKHGGAWTSHPEAELAATIRDESAVSRYRFGTATAEFFVCARCGVVPFVVSKIDDRRYAVVNVNTFEGIDPSALARTPADFDGEDTGDRLARRKRNWIGSVSIAARRRTTHLPSDPPGRPSPPPTIGEKSRSIVRRAAL